MLSTCRIVSRLPLRGVLVWNSVVGSSIVRSTCLVDSHDNMRQAQSKSFTGSAGSTAWTADSSGVLSRDGVVELPIATGSEYVRSAKQIVLDAFDDSMERVKVASGGQPLGLGMEHGYDGFVQRAPGRYDMHWGVSGNDVIKSAEPLWEPFVQEVLGEHATLQFHGVLMSVAGAAEQLWHIDGEHLFYDRPDVPASLPPHCINVFVPLVDVDRSNGGTEFCVGSQQLTSGSEDIVWQRSEWMHDIGFKGDVHNITVDAGKVLAFDYRVLHRALAHQGNEPRPVLYWTYTRRWFSDNLNFPPRHLPTVASSRVHMFADIGQEAMDMNTARQHFPAVTRDVSRVFCDGAAGTQVPESVPVAMTTHLLENNANIGGTFETSEAALEQVTRAREAVADLLGLAASSQVVFGNNTTSLLFSLANALTLGPGDNVVVSKACHDANIAPWLHAARRGGASVRWIDTTTGDCDDTSDVLDVAGAPIDENTRVVAFGLASNATGSVHTREARDLAARAQAVGALSVADATQYAAHRRVDFADLGVDVLACSAYKFFGPHVGVMGVHHEALDRMLAPKVGLRSVGDEPVHRGNRSDDGGKTGVVGENGVYDRLPADWPTPESWEICKWEQGTLNYEGLAGVEACVNYLKSIGGGDLNLAFQAIEAHEAALADRFLRGVQELPVIVHGRRTAGRSGTLDRTPTFAISPSQSDVLGGDTLAEHLVARGIYCTHGNHYAPVLVEDALQRPEGVTRISFMHYNTLGEVDRVVSALEEILQAP
eukprot:m.641204 g.641204  ORF g.641204 m.641204 type:complete len:768 (-) comp22628_c0_seq2:388-2691(-)